MTTHDVAGAFDALIEAIAKKHLRTETLKVRGRDSLDFKDCHVASIKAALEAAFKAGIEYGASR